MIDPPAGFNAQGDITPYAHGFNAQGDPIMGEVNAQGDLTPYANGFDEHGDPVEYATNDRGDVLFSFGSPSVLPVGVGWSDVGGDDDDPGPATSAHGLLLL